MPKPDSVAATVGAAARLHDPPSCPSTWGATASSGEEVELFEVHDPWSASPRTSDPLRGTWIQLELEGRGCRGRSFTTGGPGCRKASTPSLDPRGCNPGIGLPSDERGGCGRTDRELTSSPFRVAGLSLKVGCSTFPGVAPLAEGRDSPGTGQTLAEGRGPRARGVVRGAHPECPSTPSNRSTRLRGAPGFASVRSSARRLHVLDVGPSAPGGGQGIRTFGIGSSGLAGAKEPSSPALSACRVGDDVEPSSSTLSSCRGGGDAVSADDLLYHSSCLSHRH